MGGRKLVGGDAIGATPTLDGMESNPGFLLKAKNGRVLTIGAGGPRYILLDPRVPRARVWLRDRVREVADIVGSDGVALDSAIRSPGFLDLIDDPGRRYSPDFDLMIKSVSSKTPLTIFNNLSTRPDQERLLAYTRGASIEFFGLNDTISRAPAFATDVLPYLEAIGRHDDRTFLVFGRPRRSLQPYTTYDQDWRWQRYLYCAYLLATGANTRWKQHAGFLTSPSDGRAGGLEVYADALHDLGPALGNYRFEDGCYRRVFKQGLVLVVPAEAHRPIVVSLGKPLYTPEGTLVHGKVTVAPGEGRLLLLRRPGRPRSLSREFAPDRKSVV